VGNTAVNVKLLLSPRQSRGITHFIHRIAGEIALMGPEPDAAKAETPLSARSRSRVPNKQSHGNCRASTSMARLWRDQGKRGEACELLAPVYVWFTEGFDTMDLKEAKALLEALA
jgi:predicted ATPase